VGGPGGLTPEVAQLLARARVARLGTVDGDGRPHVVPVCFVLEAARAYTALDEKPKSVPPEELRRVRNLLANPQVQLLVDEYDEDWTRLAFVQLRGRASLLYPGGEHWFALQLLRAKYPQYGSMALEDRPLIRVDIEEFVAWRPGLGWQPVEGRSPE
jgi:PPOX class probable F420-dependent enzyme